MGLLNALYAYSGKSTSADKLAREACEIELCKCGKPIGKQDQYIAAFGGLQYIQFNEDETVFVDPIICKQETKQKLEDGLLMLYTGFTRSADDILREQSANTATPGAQRRVLRCMKQQAQDLRRALQNNDLTAFGELLNEGWELKKTLASGISRPEIDEWYATARKHGALGGKLLGAGGGGFLMLYADPSTHEAIKAALAGLRHTPIGLEPQGSKIVYVEENRKGR